MKTKNDTYRQKFMGYNPTLIDTITNDLSQVCEFYEHPIVGGDDFVYVLIDGVLADTEFFETDDFFKGSDYTPVLSGGEIICMFELGDMNNVY